MVLLIDLIRAIRSLKSDFGVATKSSPVVLKADSVQVELLVQHLAEIRTLARTGEIALNAERPPHHAATVVGPVEVFLVLQEEEAAGARQRLLKELAAADKDAARLAAKLANTEFVLRAPAEIVAAEQAKHADAITRRQAIERHLQALE
jgi:valyl-tRNA synthetase